MGQVAQIRPWIFEFFYAPGNPAQDATPEVAAAHFAPASSISGRAPRRSVLKASSSASIISGRATALRRIY